MAEEWYRHSTWTEEDQAQFFAKYKRAHKGFNRCQYACLQAWHLVDTKNPQLAQAALELLDLAEQEDPSFYQTFLVTRAKALDLAGAAPEALEMFRTAIRWQATSVSMKRDCCTPFGFFVLRRKLAQHYQEAMDALIKMTSDFFMPFQAYDYHVLLALLNERLGHHSEAVRHAKLALEACEIAESAFSKHRKLGLAKPNPEFHPEIQRLAAAAEAPSAPAPALWKYLLTLKRKKKSD